MAGLSTSTTQQAESLTGSTLKGTGSIVSGHRFPVSSFRLPSWYLASPPRRQQRVAADLRWEDSLSNCCLLPDSSYRGTGWNNIVYRSVYWKDRILGFVTQMVADCWQKSCRGIIRCLIPLVALTISPWQRQCFWRAYGFGGFLP